MTNTRRRSIGVIVTLGIIAGGTLGITEATSTQTGPTTCIVAGYTVHASSAAQCAQIKYYGGQP